MSKKFLLYATLCTSSFERRRGDVPVSFLYCSCIVCISINKVDKLDKLEAYEMFAY